MSVRINLRQVGTAIEDVHVGMEAGIDRPLMLWDSLNIDCVAYIFSLYP